ncbi:unnamed protein product [Calypogeia fissa]
MASPLSPIQMVKKASDRLIVSVEDVCELWPIVREGFEGRSPFKRAILNNKARNPILVERLPVEYILTTDARLRGRTALEQSPFWFRHPYANVVLVSCEDLDEYKNLLKPRLKQITQNEDREWFIVFVSKSPVNESSTKLVKKAYYRLEADFSSKKRERCCKLETHMSDPSVWEDIDNKVLECIRNTLDRRVQFYEEEVRRHLEYRFMPAWNFSNFFVVKESLAIMFEMAHLTEDALREYDEVEQIYLEIVNAPHSKAKEFGGMDLGDEKAAILDSTRKPLPQFLLEESVREFDFRQYLFARQALLLFHLNRPAEVAARSFPFIVIFSRTLLLHERRLPFCLRETWVLTACLTTVKATADRFRPHSVTPDVEKDFYRLLGDLYSYARSKLMRLGDLIGYGSRIEKTPCNSAALSMSPWPKPAIWPSVPADATAKISAKQQAESEKPELLGSTRKELLLAPNSLLREANRRRASLSSNSLLDVLESSNSFKGSFRRSDSFAGEDAALKSRPGSMKLVTNGGTASDVATGLTSPRPGSGSLLPASPGSGSSWGAIDIPMKLGEIQAAAEDALLAKITDEILHKALSSADGFEEMYMELTRAAADNYHRSWRKRHGVVLDGEVAAVYYRRGNLDSAAKLYEKVCALYAGERWNALLAEVLPRLSDCQKQLGDLAGYLSSCMKLLSLDRGLLSFKERQALQSEIVRLAHSGLQSPVSLDVSALITFTSKGGPPLELEEGDPGTLLVTVWSGFAEDISFESLSLTLMATFSADEGGKVVKSADAPVLHPGKNSVSILLPPQRPGSYVLGVLTGHIGDVKLRSHSYCYTSAASCKGGPPDSDDHLSFEKPLRPVLEVSKPRNLVTVKAAVSWRLLFDEPQWVGIIISPMEYSLKGAKVTISAGRDLDIDLDQTTELEAFNLAHNSDATVNLKMGNDSAAGQVLPPDNEVMNKDTKVTGDSITSSGPITEVVTIKDGRVDLPEWASRIASVLWLRVIAHGHAEQTAARKFSLHSASPTSPRSPMSKDVLINGTISAGNFVKDGSMADSIPSPRHDSPGLSASDEFRILDVKLEFGAGHSRVSERAIPVQYTKPFRTSTRVVSKGNDGTLLLQVTLASQLVATITILDVRLELQEGFVLVNAFGGQPYPSWLLPLVLSATSEGSLIFVVRSASATSSEGKTSPTNGVISEKSPAGESKITVHYKISGNRRIGAHAPVRVGGSVPSEEDPRTLTFTSAFVLQMPVLEQLVAVGMLPIPSRGPRVGQQVVFQWRIERLKEGWIKQKKSEGDGKSISTTEASTSAGAPGDHEELGYELKASSEAWMIAGRKKGVILLSDRVSSRVVISMACVPLVAGHVHPPSLCLANVSQAHISNSPAGPHLLCVLPPAPCSTLCASKKM